MSTLHHHVASSYDLFGAKITPTTSEGLVRLLKGHIEERRQCVIAYQNMHGLHVRLSDARFEQLHQLPQTYVHIDGMPLVYLCRMQGINASRNQRVTLVDHIWPLLRFAATERRRLFYLGGTDEVLVAGTAMIRRRFPNLIMRSHNGYFDLRDRSAGAALLEEINRFRPDLILVGMGMGRQEHWILENLEAVAPASICAVGACMEYIAGAVKTPPRWLGRAGFEWLFRFCEQPGRFWYRYIVEPWFVLAHIANYRSAIPATVDSLLQLPAPPLELALAAAELTGTSLSFGAPAALPAADTVPPFVNVSHQEAILTL